ncbi:sodium/glucose cotransporter 4-like [Oppia nitens]|uniref:sodium/glucose cotransporter 4-like n=1 Tax=Oppia nitens TaxID=1686743 RepID=UPI0023DC11DF|nr:sodium/glucose cotransporter 4-like [Oppia nitens]
MYYWSESGSAEPDGVGVQAHSLHWSDYLVIGLYFAGILAVGYWSSRKSQGDSVSGYFLANRSMHWIPVGASLFASNVGSGHFVGLAGSGASSGLSISAFEFNAMFVLLVLGWFFLPVYFAAGVNTMPEYLRKRFGGQRIRIYLSVLALLLYIFTKISADLFAGALFIKQALGLNMYVSVIILLAISAVFTMAGGLTTVMWTDFVQTILMLIGALVLTILSLIEVKGYSNLMDNFATLAEPTNQSYAAIEDGKSCSAVNKYYRNLLRPANDADLPWTGMVFGITISAVWYWCSDQVIVQRALSAKNISHAKAGCTLCSFLKISPLYLMVLPGMAARALWPNEVGCSDAAKCKSICGSEAGCTNIAYPLLVLRIMPKGVTGLMLSVMMAALMSSLTSIFNSASTIFTIDIYNRFRRQASEIEQVIAGRAFVLFLVVISIFWIPIIETSQNSQLFNYIQSVTSYLSPPVCAVYVLAIFWGRINEKGAFWGLMIGLAIGIVRFVMEFSYSVPLCGSGVKDSRPTILSEIHYLHFGIILFVISLIVTTVISLLTKPMEEKNLYRLTYWSKYSQLVREDIDCEEQVSKQSGESNNCFVSDEMPTEDTIKDRPIDQSSEDKQKRRLLYTICCVGSANGSTDDDLNVENKCKIETKEEEAVRCAEEAKENDTVWRGINNLFAILAIAVTAFFWGYYA